jgi:hypothetical protein
MARELLRDGKPLTDDALKADILKVTGIKEDRLWQTR